MTPGRYLSFVPASAHDKQQQHTPEPRRAAEHGDSRGRGEQRRTSLVEVDGVVVGDLVDEAEQGDLVRAEPRRGVPGADVLDGDRRGGQRRQHQPLPEVPAAG
jgi:hypothetical protein